MDVHTILVTRYNVIRSSIPGLSPEAIASLVLAGALLETGAILQKIACDVRADLEKEHNVDTEAIKRGAFG